MGRVAVTLTNTDAWILSASDSAYAALDAYWSFYPPGYQFHPAYKIYVASKQRALLHGTPARGWDGKIKLLKNGAVPAGLFRASKKDIRDKLGIRFRVSYDRPAVSPLKAGFASGEGKYQFQDKCVASMCKSICRGGGIVLSATGSGKTKTAAQFFAKLPYQCLFIVDQIDLLYQSQQELAQWLGEPIGVVGDSEYSPRRITVATIQTLSLHVKKKAFQKWLKTLEIVVVDELHAMLAKRNVKVLDTIQPIARFGLTATLQLRKKEIRTRAYAFAGPVIFRFPIAKAMEKGVVSKGRVIQLLFEDLDFGFESYAEHYEQEVWANPIKLRAAAAIASYLEHKGYYQFGLVSRIKHLKKLSRRYDKLGIQHDTVWGGVAKTARVEAKDAFEQGDSKTILANVVFQKGINVKRVDAILDLAEMKDKNNCLQKFGRGSRLHQDKKQLLYIDFGTQGSARFAKAARSRARAFRAEGIQVQTIKASSVQQAVEAIRKEVEKSCNSK